MGPLTRLPALCRRASIHLAVNDQRPATVFFVVDLVLPLPLPNTLLGDLRMSTELSKDEVTKLCQQLVYKVAYAFYDSPYIILLRILVHHNV